MKPEDLTVADVMTTDVITLHEDSTLGHAEREMGRSDIRHLPVVTRAGKLLGILSDRDLLRALRDPGDPGRRVSTVMTREVLTVSPWTLGREATALLLDHKIGALPVVDRDGRVVGLVTETDFLRLAHRVLGGSLSASPDDYPAGR